MKLFAKRYEFAKDKNEKLIQERKISFDEVIEALNNDCLLDVIEHPNHKRYPGQNIFIIEIKGYVYVVPFIKKGLGNFFLKTIFPSRKLTKQYLYKDSYENDKEQN